LPHASRILLEQQMPNSPVRLTRSQASYAGQSGYGGPLVTAASRPKSITSACRGRQLSEVQCEVLRQPCISDGNAAITRQSGISLLTVRYRLPKLNHELDAADGASKRGWLDVK
jgi:hypothetical protein